MLKILKSDKFEFVYDTFFLIKTYWTLMERFFLFQASVIACIAALFCHGLYRCLIFAAIFFSLTCTAVFPNENKDLNFSADFRLPPRDFKGRPLSSRPRTPLLKVLESSWWNYFSGSLPPASVSRSVTCRGLLVLVQDPGSQVFINVWANINNGYAIKYLI